MGNSELPVEQSIPAYPFSHSQNPLERHFPRALQPLGHKPKDQLNKLRIITKRMWFRIKN